MFLNFYTLQTEFECAAGCCAQGDWGKCEARRIDHLPANGGYDAQPVVLDRDRWTNMEAGLHTWRRARLKAIWVEIEPEMDRRLAS